MLSIKNLSLRNYPITAWQKASKSYYVEKKTSKTVQEFNPYKKMPFYFHPKKIETQRTW